ncbi:AcrR family transcriptional regulator [Rhodococcus sp. LBL1]|uniref:AcrR family transcriptional regulator n=1 Tax=Prescottella agglutinans TaxID=1644129 RepID=A0ABT6MCP1_9NOCA|nr:TetR/AcrR family transcriptional regulator [Prescottella agglutinans]MDH6281645.1 AcrR family transcriptional regulator [Prescottella agglutinans]MDH6675880.1 AcrR family transcriptional regulator [Rhodococcus sp. LBL1]MDH6681166.1 AcrR family transcriptional regulator [Rhodococcus sp. LBL2]
MSEPHDRKSEILDAAAALFAVQGIAGTSMREIGDAVGLNAGALYHYFRSKGAIVNELVTGFLADLLAHYRAMDLDRLEPRARLKAIVDVSLTTGAARPDATKVYHAEFANLRKLRDYAEARALADEIQKIWLDAIEAGKDTGVLRKDVPSKVFHRFLRDSVWFTVYWRKPDDPYTLEELSADCISVFLDGMAVSPE